MPSREIEDMSSPSSSILEISREPTPALFRKAHMIFEGLDYFNKIICPDMVSDDTHFNPYRVNHQRISKIPQIYVNVLVSTAALHKLLSRGVEPIESSALFQREVHVFALRIEALRALNQQLAFPESQTSDATLLCVLALMIAAIQASPYGEWRSHIEGARRIIQMRGGLKRIIQSNPYFKPVLTYFILIDVMSSTTTSSTRQDRRMAAYMALHYGAIEPNMFQYISTTCMPVPADLFQAIIMVNYIRTMMHNERMQARRQSATRVVLQRIVSFSVSEYEARMRCFNGWKTTGRELEFTTDVSSSSSTGSPGPQTTSPSSNMSTSNVVAEFWQSLGTIYRASVLLYALRTLVFESNDDPSSLLPDIPNQTVTTLRIEALTCLASHFAPVLSDSISRHKLGKLILWPMFIMGMEADYRDASMREFLINGFAHLSQAMGTAGPLGAIDELGRKWELDEGTQKGPGLTWDDYFDGRDYIVF